MKTRLALTITRNLNHTPIQGEALHFDSLRLKFAANVCIKLIHALCILLLGNRFEQWISFDHPKSFLL